MTPRREKHPTSPVAAGFRLHSVTPGQEKQKEKREKKKREKGKVSLLRREKHEAHCF
jgi:hypothetical protein